MVKIQNFDGYSVLGGKLTFVYDEGATIADKYAKNLVLAPRVGEDMTYDNEVGVIDYPGEYELQNIMVKARADKKGVMNFIVSLGKQSVVFVQSKAFLDYEDDFPEDVSQWVFLNDTIKEYWEKHEFEGEFIDLSKVGEENEGVEENE